MRRASLFALSGIFLGLPLRASAAEPPPLPADATTPPASETPPAAPGDAPPTLPSGDPGAVAPPAGAEGAAGGEVSGAVSGDLSGSTNTTTTEAPAPGPEVEVPAPAAKQELSREQLPGYVQGRREPAVNSLRGGLGLYHTTLADVGGRHTVRVRLHTDFFRKEGFIYNSDEHGPDQQGRVRGTVNIGYSPFKWGEVYLAVHSQASRNARAQPGRQDQVNQFALGDLDFGIKGAHRFVKGGAIGLGGQMGIGLLSGTSRLLTDKVNFNIDFLFTLDVRYLTKKQVPVRFSTNIGWILDNSSKLIDFEKFTDPTSREVSRFALGVAPSRVRMRYGLDFPVRLGKEGKFGLDPIVELAWDVATAEMPVFFQAGARPSPLPRSSLWGTVGLRANVIAGLHLDAAVDIGMVSPNFEYGPPVAPWQVILGLGWSIDPNPVIKEVPAPATSEPLPAPAVVEGRVVGQVFDSTGAPVPGAKVRFPGAASNAILTDDQGNFTSYRFPEGQVAIQVELANKATKDATADIKAGEDTQITITMDVANTPPVGILDGAFTDEAGQPVLVTLAVSGNGVDEPFTSTEGGLIRLELPAGDYFAIARAPGFEDKSLRFTVAPGEQFTTVKESLRRATPVETPLVSGKGKKLRLKKAIRYTSANGVDDKSAPLVEQLAAFLNTHPEYEEIEIGVHTDDRGNPKQRSSERADAVRSALLAKGVSPERVTANGYGDNSPVAVNLTAAGRAKNNRTAIKVTRYKGAPTAPAKPAKAPKKGAEAAPPSP
ncbi:OmpA family protein [Nannocystis punicea]|uniref:OmpA family protein n=1 Tax=Nannocystis punicea TaxID=2995304 RepID=A0ABY7GSK1_9BACT|nr:OmpA family protein [Nannocystis poenicansa]WAS89903.1 OmpA family protein [Nannocystis poenicansa]